MTYCHDRPATVLILAVMAVLALAGGFVAVPTAAASSGSVPPGQTYHGTLPVRNGSASIQGTVEGNVLVDDHASLTVTGTVTGWVHAYGDSTITLDGAVEQGASQSTGTLDVQPRAEIGQNLDTYSLARRLEMLGRIDHQLRVSASGLDVGRQASVGGDVWVWAKRSQLVQIQGHVGGGVQVSGTNLNLGKNASIDGRIHVWSGRVVRADGTTNPPATTPAARTATLAWGVGAAIAVVLALIVGVVWFRLRRRSRATQGG